MKIGHINLAKTFNGHAAQFVGLVEALDRQGISQYVIVRNRTLAKRISVYENVVVGPVTGSSILASCLMPNVDILHAHNARSATTGLLLNLTRSTPYVLTRRNSVASRANHITRSIDDRAAGLICNNELLASQALSGEMGTEVHVIKDIARENDTALEMAGNRAAAEHLRVYRRAVDSWQVPLCLQ